MLDPSFDLIRTNNTFQNLLGLSAENALHLSSLAVNKQEMNRNIKDFSSPDTRNKTFHIKLRNNLGGSIWASIEIARLPEEMMPHAYILYLEEVAFEHILESHVKGLELHPKVFGANSREALFRYSHRNGISGINRVMMEMFGMEKVEDIYRIQLSSLFNDPADAERLLLQEITNTAPVEEVISMRRFNGEQFWAYLTLRLPTERLESHTYSFSVIDITDYKRLQKRYEVQSEQLNTMQVELDRFVYSASHDIKAPLTTIQGLINLLKMDGKDASKYISLFDKPIASLEYFINEIVSLTFSRNHRSHVEKINLQEVIDIALRKARMIIGDQPSAVSIQLEDGADFYCDKDRLRHILLHVLNNSFHYADKNKDRTEISVWVQTTSLEAKIIIRDNGIGIAPVHLPQVFRIFYRGSEISPGSGLGLYIVQEAIKKLKGQIEINSEYGVYTEVSITIPNSTKGRLIHQKKLLRSKQIPED